ncbi:probable glycosyltransferase STELLO1 [Phalaenopsis equestris]|uniref:probable glycosyltransferase STELLO1 n=1 Tax=Phalaenopsis equestris TaxID=78828 RepID=UPI0009E6362F|nr:probable glycosyltransferase STELLO1 [Phalaenopsis equestris]
MLIQDRGTADAASKPSKPSPRPLTYANSAIHGKKSGDPSFSSSSSSCSTYKLIALLIFLASIAALFFLRGTIDGAALLCLDRRPTRPLPVRISYPEISWSTIPALRPVDDAAVAPFATFRSERWIVVSVSTPPTDSLRLLVKTRGWQLLAVGNSHTPADWSLKGAIFLSLDLQSSLGFRTVDFLPYASYVRKSIGYLFAIQHGAKIIYDADDRSEILSGDLSKHFDLDLGEATGSASGYPVLLQYCRTANKNRTVVNPYVHFGQRSVWPRGLPLESIREVSHEEFYSEIRGGGQFIQQGLSNGLPDVDSVFYFTRKSSRSEPYDILFDEDAPKVALPQGLMVPVNSFNTIFHSQSFWGLMLPVSVSSMASDVIRGYFAQRILWEIGGYVAVYPPTIHRQDRAEAYPFSEEKDLHVNVARLIEFLVSWRSTKPTIFERILDLSYAMAKEGFWSEMDVQLTAAWLRDLISIGYQQPRMVSLALDGVKEASRDRREFVPRKISSIHLGVDESGSVNYEIGNLIRWRRNFGNVVLIMYCSGPVERTALEWRLLYGRIFKTVVILSEHNSTVLAVEYGELSTVYK